MRKSCRARRSQLGGMPLFMRCASACLLLLVSSLSYALSLGEVQIESPLNEPLRGSIPVYSASASELGSLRVGLAGQQDWQRAGLAPSSAVNRIKFGFKSTGGGKLAVTLRTEEPVSEPLLVILVDASWSGGHLLREYTVFLDPAGLAPANTAPVATPRVSAAVPSQNQPAPTSTRRNVNPFLVSNALSTGSYGPVRRGESLSTISEGIFLGTDLSMHQVVWALYEANPEAFVRGNINHLEVGATLTVPTEAEMLAMPAVQARELVFQAARLQRPPPGMFAGKSKAAPSADGASTGNVSEANTSRSHASGETQAAANTQRAITQEAEPEPKPEPESATENSSSRVTQNSPAVSNDKLELLPLETVVAVGSGGDDSAGNGPGELDATGGGVGAAEPDSAPLADVRSSRERQLANENALLRGRIDETEALLKEIRALLAARSEQLSELQTRLDKVEKAKLTGTQQAEAAPAAVVGWFWWLLLAVAIVVALLLVALLFVLTRKQERGVDKSRLSFDDDDGDEVLFAGPLATTAGAPASEGVPTGDDAQIDNEVEAFIEQNLIMPKSAKSERPSMLSAEDSAPVPPLVADEPTIENTDPIDEPTLDSLEEGDQASDLAPKHVDELGVERRLPVEDSPLDFNLDDYSAPKAEPDASTTAEQAATEIDIELPELGDELGVEAASETDAEELLPILNEAELESLEIESQLAEPGAGLTELDADISLQEIEVESQPNDESIAESLTELAEESAEEALDEPLTPIVELDDEPAMPVGDSASTDVSEISGGDQVATKLDLARVYVDMGDADEARSILNEVLDQGDAAQQQEAQTLLDSLA